MDLSYVIDKIKQAKFLEHPFRHIEINDLFETKDFNAVIQSSQITLQAENDEKLFDRLLESNYKVVNFPGCTQDIKEYIKWHKNKKLSKKTNSACEGYGVVLRLEKPNDDAIKTLFNFIHSPEFVNTIAEKFDLEAETCTYDTGIQKYLDGYEISPHPDIRKKALTYMVNINPGPTSHQTEHHTSYLSFKPEWSFVKEFWAGNPKVDRCWVPWDWCKIEKQQRENNSIVIFSPNNNTIHAVKANYDHLKHQRTQLYGNLWHKNINQTPKVEWEGFVLSPKRNAFKRVIFDHLPTGVQRTLSSVIENYKHKKPTSTHSKRKVQ